MGAPGLIAAFTAGAATLAGGRALVHWGIRKGLAAPRVPHHTEPGALGLAFETLRIGTENGKSLHAWFIPGPARAAVAEAEVATAAAPAVLVMHGWGGNAALMLPLARPLHEAGYATLFVDARCHGASDDDSFASLPRFAEDTEHAFAWLSTRAGVDPARIALLGHSVGAGAVLFAASRTPQVAAVVSVAAFSHPAAMMRRWLAAKRIPEKPVGRYILDYVQKTIGHRFDDIAPVTTIARIRRPVLLVHGADDEVVPIDEAMQIYAMRGDTPVELMTLTGDHESFADLEHHMGRLVGFLDRVLAVGPSGL
ncbi:BAAT/acyl-CoA thioester hydrolase [Thauera phenylacetica B4P]|uniref:BAAT/acyl-CoA thioester hydrolase n=1 Tax=Thauera phenylacetica B4P TaxID=1234382 RepID=N6YTD5_9RHOO|nr:alpha/beta fold hydrolase [Thauera phenylacetica]ENO97541.1 BAAT/acyl-CoA thioester hydrolase [Thauera phenylacetica B4P]